MQESEVGLINSLFRKMSLASTVSLSVLHDAGDDNPNNTKTTYREGAEVGEELGGADLKT